MEISNLSNIRLVSDMALFSVMTARLTAGRSVVAVEDVVYVIDADDLDKIVVSSSS